MFKKVLAYDPDIDLPTVDEPGGLQEFIEELDAQVDNGGDGNSDGE